MLHTFAATFISIITFSSSSPPHPPPPHHLPPHPPPSSLSAWIVLLLFVTSSSSCYPDPMNWTKLHVSKWLDWAEREFGFDSIDRSNFKLTGAQLCSISLDEFVKRSPPYTGDIMLSHLNLLRARSGEYRRIRILIRRSNKR